LPRRLRSRPMESEHPVMEINITLLLLRKFGNLIDKVVFQQRETTKYTKYFVVLFWAILLSIIL